MSAERVPYPELDCALAMSKVKGNLLFLESKIKEEWKESETSALAVKDAIKYLQQAQDEYKKVLTIIKLAHKI